MSRGWVAASGLPDETRSGRQILKDFVNGKLLHCERPPACSLNNTQLGLSGQLASASKHAVQTQAGLSGTVAARADRSEAQLSGDSHAQSEGASGSASEPNESSEEGASGAELSQADDAAAVSSSSDTEAAAHSATLNDADRELMESMSNVQGRHVQVVAMCLLVLLLQHTLLALLVAACELIESILLCSRQAWHLSCDCWCCCCNSMQHFPDAVYSP